MTCCGTFKKKKRTGKEKLKSMLEVLSQAAALVASPSPSKRVFTTLLRRLSAKQLSPCWSGALPESKMYVRTSATCALSHL
jgi:hypothetical protein